MLIQDNVKTNDFGSCLILQPQQMTIGCSFENLRKLIGQIIEKLVKTFIYMNKHIYPYYLIN